MPLNERSFLRTGTCSIRTISGSSPESVVEAEVSGQAVRLGALVSLDAVEREHIARVVAQSPSLEVGGAHA